MRDADRAKATITEMAGVGQAIVTLLLADDRDGAGDLMMSEFPAEDGNDPRLVTLALVLADLVAFVHNGWCGQLGLDPADAWRIVLERVAGWREGTL